MPLLPSSTLALLWDSPTWIPGGVVEAPDGWPECRSPAVMGWIKPGHSLATLSAFLALLLGLSGQEKLTEPLLSKGTDSLRH